MKSAEVKTYTAILVALEGAAESVRNLLRDQGNHAVMQQALDALRDPKNTVALQAMVRGAIAGAANALNFESPATMPPPSPPLPDGWPPGWTLGQDTTGGKVQYTSVRIVKPNDIRTTGLRWDDSEDARRDAWERHWSENTTLPET